MYPIKNILIMMQKLLILCCIVLSSNVRLYAYDVPTVKDYSLVSVETLLKKCPDVDYAEFKGPTKFNYEPLPFSKFPQYQPHIGTLDKTWVLTIPHGRVCSYDGYVLVNEKYMLRDTIPQCEWFGSNLHLINGKGIQYNKVRKITGRVVVLARRFVSCYGHWIMDILGRLAMIEAMGIDYDYIYVPDDRKFQKESLQAWGIEPHKIIQPWGEFYYIEADELIVPSSAVRVIPTPGQTFSGLIRLSGVYWPTWAIEYLRNKFLPLVNKNLHEQKFSKKVFISRKDTNLRQMNNEDEAFKLLEAEGFERYELGNLSFLEQVELFSNADIVIGANGSGLVNIMFCKPTTKVIEIFQARSDSTFYYLGQTLGLNYTCIKTMEFSSIEAFENTEIPIEIFHDVIKILHDQK